jgi:hypothetical protein
MRKAVSKMHTHSIGRTVGSVRTQLQSLERQIREVDCANKRFSTASERLRESLDARGFRTIIGRDLTYQEGQRAEASFVCKSALTGEVIREQSTVAREVHLLFMSKLLGWQSIVYERMRERALTITRAGESLLKASNTDVATTEHRHSLAAALSCFGHAGPPIQFMAFRHKKRKRSEAADDAAARRAPPKAWHPVSYYEKQHERQITTGKTRDKILMEIRRDALLTAVTPRAEAGAPALARIWLAVSPSGSRFLDLRSSEGLIADTISDVALHIYNSFGRDWRGKVLLKLGARRAFVNEKLDFDAAAATRDAKFQSSRPDIEGLASLHRHSLHNDHPRPAKDRARGI